MRKGWTVIELLVVLAIIAICALVVGVFVQHGCEQDAQRSFCVAKGHIGAQESIIDSFKEEFHCVTQEGKLDGPYASGAAPCGKKD
jgi:prepilin-type N-terminal cleavage/methylation domain-containing protein